jgi:hypothetical protein
MREVEVLEVFAHDGITYFMHREMFDGWHMSEWTSGFCVERGDDDIDGEGTPEGQESVKARGIARVTKVGREKVLERIRQAIVAYGQANAEVPA